MTGAQSAEELPNERTIAITRVVKAPREVVFQAWLDPQHLAAWWGPKSFTNPVCEVDARPGGSIRIVMRAPDGTDYPMTGSFREIAPPERIVFTTVAVDLDGRVLLEGLTTVTFVAEGGGTKLTVDSHAIGRTSGAPRMLAGMEAGWSGSLDKLTELLPKL